MSTNREPKINLRKPDLSYWGPLDTEVHETPSAELLAEVRDFYDSSLVPELVCIPDGPDRPGEGWITAPGRKLVTTRTRRGGKHGRLVGCWILKDSGIYYPCIDVSQGREGCLPILRALAYESFKAEGTKMWASTDNAIIQSWVNHATSTPEEGRPEDMPLPKFENGRVEWK